MSPAPHRSERAPPCGHGHHRYLFGGPIILPPVRHASRSFVLAAARLRALHPDPLLTAGARPLPRTETGTSTTRLTPAPAFIESPSGRDHRHPVALACVSASPLPMITAGGAP